MKNCLWLRSRQEPLFYTADRLVPWTASNRPALVTGAADVGAAGSVPGAAGEGAVGRAGTGLVMVPPVNDRAGLPGRRPTAVEEAGGRCPVRLYVAIGAIGAGPARRRRHRPACLRLRVPVPRGSLWVSPWAETPPLRVPVPRGSRSGDVTWARIVRGGLARIERGRIPSRRARTARGGVDGVAGYFGCARAGNPFRTR